DEGGGGHDEHAHDDGGSNEDNADAAVLQGAGGFTLANGGHVNVTGTALVDTSARIDNGTVFVDGDAEFSGPSIFGVNADVEIDDADDTLRLRGQTTLIGPSVVGSGRIIFEDNVNVAFFDTSIGCAETDLDGLLGTTNILINQGLRFSIASSLIEPTANDGFDGTITNRGTFSVLAGWRLDGEIDMDQIGATIPEVDGFGPFRIHTTGTYMSDGASRILSPLQAAGAMDLGGGLTQVNNTASFEATANVDVAAGGELELNGATTFAAGAYDGPGTIQLNAATAVTANTTISTGRIDLDGAAENTHLTLTNAALVLNTGGVDAASNFFTGQIDATGASARLEVNLPLAASWTVGSTGVVNLSNALFGPIRTMLDGSDVLISGDLNVNGQVALGANVTLQGDLQTANIVTDVHFASGGQNFIQQFASVGGSGEMTIDQGTRLHFGDGVLVGIDVENSGRLEIGYAGGDLSTPGDTIIRSDFRQTATGTFGVDIGGLLVGDEYDQLQVIGQAELLGAIDIQLIDGFSPLLGQSFTVLTAGSVLGQFTAVHEPVGLPPGLLFDVVYNPTNVQLVVVQGPIYSADFDMDGDVDGADLAQWKGDFGLNGDSDADADGDSDGTDFLMWQQQLGSVPAVAAGTTVPEPANAILLAVSAAAAIGLRRRC
nr:PEP-CTERM sorting domain-containing protein [Pirellulales bacterium]